MRRHLAALSFAGFVAAIPPQPGLRIVVRETSGGNVDETTEYVLPDRAVKIWSGGQGPGAAHITRCDQGRYIALNFGDRTYMTGQLSARTALFRSAMLAAAAGSGTTGANAPAPKPPTLLIETTTVDTGQRKKAFGHPARRVITTRKEIPLEGSRHKRSETETDGWYIDLETRPSCEREDEGEGHYFLSAVVLTQGGEPAEAPVLTFNDIGQPERGYAIETKTAMRSTPSSSSTGWDSIFVTRTVVTALSTEPLEPSLFEIPAGFRNAESPLQAFASHLAYAWQVTRDLLAAVFKK